jgi:hypothetical protein
MGNRPAASPSTSLKRTHVNMRSNVIRLRMSSSGHMICSWSPVRTGVGEFDEDVRKAGHLTIRRPHCAHPAI